jgi:hypothetical protein
MIDLATWHAVLGCIMALSSLGLLIVLWQLIEQGVEGITYSEGLPLQQGAFILSLRFPRTQVMFAYRLTFAYQTH